MRHKIKIAVSVVVIVIGAIVKWNREQDDLVKEFAGLAIGFGFVAFAVFLNYAVREQHKK